MTNFAKFKIMTIEELTDFLDENSLFDNSPWTNWFAKKYCDTCESIEVAYTDVKEKLGISPLSYSGEVNCAYCELNNYCRFFPQIEGIPNNKEVIKMWLNEEAEHDSKTTT